MELKQRRQKRQGNPEQIVFRKRGPVESYNQEQSGDCQRYRDDESEGEPLTHKGDGNKAQDKDLKITDYRCQARADKTDGSVPADKISGKDRLQKTSRKLDPISILWNSFFQRHPANRKIVPKKTR